MSGIPTQERLFPSLLDRLTDDQPNQTVESRERRIFSVHKLREAVLRDLGWLLSTCQLAVSEDLEAYPSVKTSVLNYGIPDLTGKSISSLQAVDVERSLRQAILDFEPRILPQKLQVRVQVTSDSVATNSMSFEIEGELWSRPIPERLFLRTELDLESGIATINEV
jgi:type VI secretion system protein ImpF